MYSITSFISRLRNLVVHGTYIPIGYYLFDEKRAAYIPIPKVACTSIKVATVANDGENNVYDKYMKIHSEAEVYYQLSLKPYQENYYKFAFVRNPLDRLVSCYEDKVKKSVQHIGRYYFDTAYNNILLKTLFRSGFSPEMSFPDFIQLVSKIPDILSDGHFRSQYSILYKRGRLVPDYVGKFENLPEDWTPLAEKFGFPPLTRKNPSKRNDLQHYYNTSEILELAATRYRDDIHQFGYQEEYNELKNTLSTNGYLHKSNA